MGSSAGTAPARGGQRLKAAHNAGKIPQHHGKRNYSQAGATDSRNQVHLHSSSHGGPYRRHA